MSPSSAADCSTAARDTLVSWREMFHPSALPRNVVAGVTVAFVALPLNVALALACNLPASVGLLTGAVVGLVGALLGGARLQITGPEVALAPLCLEIVMRHGLNGLWVATLLAGLLQIGFGALRLGRLIHLMPVPVVGGFLAAVGVLLWNAQLPRLLGLPADIRAITQLRDPVLLLHGGAAPVIGLVVVGVILGVRRVAPRAPGALLGVGLGVLVMVLFGWQVPTVAAFTPTLPRLGLPPLHTVDLFALWPEALALALLASIDSLLCAVSLDAATRARRHHSDQELVAQGICNVLSACIGGMPVAGAVVRSMAAVEAGATNRLAPVVQSVVLLGIFFLAAPLVGVVPIAALAAVLLVVGARLVNLRSLARSWRVARFETLVFLGTALGILTTDFVSGVGIGLVMALVQLARNQRSLILRVQHSTARHVDRDVKVVALHGPVFFASHTRLDRLMHTGGDAPRVVVDLAGVPFVDWTGIESLRAAIEHLRARGTEVLMAAANETVAAALHSAELMSSLTSSRLFQSVDAALAHAHVDERRAAPATRADHPMKEGAAHVQLSHARP